MNASAPFTGIAPDRGATPGSSISVRNLTVSYANGLTAVHDASFELDPGTICALVGVNGSGKSTIFKAIMGFVQPAAGDAGGTLKAHASPPHEDRRHAGTGDGRAGHARPAHRGRHGLRADQLLIMNAMGGGFTWGAAVLRW